MASYIFPPTGGGSSPYFGDPVASFASLPPSGSIGEIRVVLDEDNIYEWNGTAWQKITNSSADVSGPGSAVDNNIAVFNGTTGKIIKDGGTTISTLTTSIAAKLPLAGGTMVGDLILNADPSLALGAATKQYVDSFANNIKWKEPVVVATTTAGTLASSFENGDTIDGVVLATGNRILIKNQVTASENGIYTVNASGAPTRASDANTFALLNGACVFVNEGTVNADRGFMQTATLTSLSSNQVWVQNFGTGLYTADGQGVKLSGSVFMFSIDGTTLSQSASGAKVASGGITNTEVNASAAIARTKVAAGTANTLVYNAATTGILADLSITANRALASDSNGLPVASTTTDTELGYVNGVTSAIQTQLDGKSATITGAATTALFTNFMASKAIISTSGGKLSVHPTTTSTEIGYLTGITSAVQTQLDAKMCATSIVAVSTNVTLTNKGLHLVDTTSARSLTLPTPASGSFIIVKDSTGSCGTNNITLVRAASEKIETVAANYTLNTDLGSWTIISNGTDWWII